MRSESDAAEQFASEVDVWLRVVLVVLPLISVGVVVVTLLNDGEGAWAAVLSLLVVGGIYGGLLFPLYYHFEAGSLLVRFGLVRQRIPYEAIRSVRPTRNPLSSPALSLRRLRVDYGRSFVLISPVRRGEFLDELAQRTGLVRDGETLGPSV
jgi:hypothetical protein